MWVEKEATAVASAPTVCLVYTSLGPFCLRKPVRADSREARGPSFPVFLPAVAGPHSLTHGLRSSMNRAARLFG